MPIYDVENADQLEVEITVSPAPSVQISQRQGAYAADISVIGPQGPSGVIDYSASNTWTGSNRFDVGSSNAVPIIAAGATSRTGDLQQWSDGQVRARMDFIGRLAVQRLTAGSNVVDTHARLVAQSMGSGEIVSAVRGAPGQTADMSQWISSTGVTMGRFSATGSITHTGVHLVGTNTFEDVPSQLGVLVASNDPSRVGLMVRGSSGQTGNLQEWRNSAGSILARVTPVGNGHFNELHTIGLVQAGGEFRAGMSGYTDPLPNVPASAKFRGTNTSAVGIGVSPGGPATVGAIVRGLVGQTADLMQWQTDTGSVMSRINRYGDFSGGSVTASYAVYATGNTPTVTPLQVQGASGQTSDLAVFKRSDGFNLAKIDTGGFVWSSSGAVLGTISAAVGGGIPLQVVNTVATRPAGVLRGANNQTADIQQWQTNTGTILSRVANDGKMFIDNKPVSTNVVVSKTNPNLVGEGMWVQTFDDGSFTFWIEDGV